MLLATVFALTAAVLHAGWNLLAKRAGDPFLALWGQFMFAGAIGAVVLLATGGVPAGAWTWALISGGVHIPYIVALGWAYRHGDFSLAYPLARGGGALLAAIGGIVLLGDDLKVLSMLAICTVVAGMVLLAIGAERAQVLVALIVAGAIGVYTLADSHASREYDTRLYIFATQAVTGVTVSIAGLAMGRGPRSEGVPVVAMATHDRRRADDDRRLRSGVAGRPPGAGGLRRRLPRVERADRGRGRFALSRRGERPGALDRRLADPRRTRAARALPLTSFVHVALTWPEGLVSAT